MQYNPSKYLNLPTGEIQPLSRSSYMGKKTPEADKTDFEKACQLTAKFEGLWDLNQYGITLVLLVCTHKLMTDPKGSPLQATADRAADS